MGSRGWGLVPGGLLSRATDVESGSVHTRRELGWPEPSEFTN